MITIDNLHGQLPTVDRDNDKQIGHSPTVQPIPMFFVVLNHVLVK